MSRVKWIVVSLLFVVVFLLLLVLPVVVVLVGFVLLGALPPAILVLLGAREDIAPCDLGATGTRLDMGFGAGSRAGGSSARYCSLLSRTLSGGYRANVGSGSAGGSAVRFCSCRCCSTLFRYAVRLERISSCLQLS